MAILLPVIHVQSPKQAIENVKIVQDAGCGGCFLINHSIDHKQLLHAYEKVVSKFPEMWVGLNILGMEVGEAVERTSEFADGLWVDNLGVKEDGDNLDLLTLDNVRANDLTLLFGGTAFKYQESVKDVAKVAAIAAKYCDVVTTSGDATGSAPAVEKIRLMSEAVGDRRLAIASGISLENVESFLPYAYYFLVASSISKSFTELDFDKTKALAEKIHNVQV
jgi:hypothetical protein